MWVLVDTNILVRSVERAHPLMRQARQALKALYRQGDELCVAHQNIAEFWNVCTRPVSANGLENSIPILTFNVSDFARYGNVSVIDPASLAT
jgi:hypothetical protein